MALTKITVQKAVKSANGSIELSLTNGSGIAFKDLEEIKLWVKEFEELDLLQFLLFLALKLGLQPSQLTGKEVMIMPTNTEALNSKVILAVK